MALGRHLTATAALLLVAAVWMASPVRAADLDRGKDLYSLCAQCHGAAGGGNEMYLAPSIAGLEDWYVAGQLKGFRDGLRGKQYHDIAGMRMRPMALTLDDDADLDSVSAYVASLPPQAPTPVVQGDPARGQTFYATCAACHGAKGEGNKQLFGPALTHTSDWYTLRQLQNFKAGVRGAQPGDQNGALMRSMTNTLPDAQAMNDVVAYIMTLREQD